MKMAVFLNFFTVSSALVTVACSTQKSVLPSTENPLQSFESVKTASTGNPTQDYSLERRKFDAAMYLYGQAQTDLKSGNAAKAIGELALAREYNPWHDDIKDLYVVAVKYFVKSTNALGATTDCEIIDQRLNFLNDTAPDYLAEAQDQSSRCHFTPKKQAAVTEDYISDIKVPANSSGVMGRADITLLGDVDAVVKRNQHIPTAEILTLALDYFSKLSINVGSPSVSELATDSNEFDIVLPIKFNIGSGMSSKKYCEETRKYLEVKASTTRLECDYWSYWGLSNGGHGQLEYNAQSQFSQSPKFGSIWPLPSDMVVAFKLHYQNKPDVILRDVIHTQFRPDQVDAGYGFVFNYVSGDLPLSSADDDAFGRHVIPKDNASIVIKMNQEQTDGLIGISAFIDLKATKDLYL